MNQAPARVGVTNQDVKRPYIVLSPLLRSLSQVKSTGCSTHNALQARLNKRFSHGFTGLASYTFGKTLDIASDTESGTRSHADAERDLRTAVRQGPGGRRRRFVGSGQAIVLLRTGLPINITQQCFRPARATARIASPAASSTIRPPDRWFDISASVPTRDNTGTWGNSGRNILLAPGQA